MRVHKGRLARMMLTASASVVGLVVLTANAAQAVTDDGFRAVTTDAGGCGVAEFVDYGAGAPGGGDNDDYVVIHDYCSDGHGVKAYAWLVVATTSGTQTTYLGAKYNGNGLAGTPVYWDPFPSNEVWPGETVALKVCLVDGNSDPTASKCGENRRTSQDG